MNIYLVSVRFSSVQLNSVVSLTLSCGYSCFSFRMAIVYVCPLPCHPLTLHYISLGLFWHAQQVVTKGLAESKSFQRFALSTHQGVQKLKEAASDPKATEDVLRNLQAKVESLQKPSATSTMKPDIRATPERAADLLSRFQEALKEELKSDLRGGNKR